MTPSPFDVLTQINLDDLVSAFGWGQYPFLSKILQLAFISPARNFAQNMMDFDTDIARVGLGEAARQNLRDHYVQDLRAHGMENIPATGPALFLSNHPGLVDTLALFSAINRADLRIIAIERPFLATLANTSKQLFYISEDESERIRAVRQVSSHLKNGFSALTFPAGEIEPDPAVHNDAIDSLAHWTNSAGVFIRFARDTVIVPTLVSGVVWEASLRNPLLWFKQTRKERELLAAAFQAFFMLSRNFRPTTVHVRFAKPITLDEIGSTETDAIHRIVIERMRGLIQNSPTDHGTSIL
ncbi:MAG TPA: 1-acyl-sn-glycerol-3-phosphate acyltransferase [Anaerolineales bacterium]|nr:1-acyl-sn-glycerol-3-phosphate acyltransferase [Anaerolineales bacterium]